MRGRAISLSCSVLLALLSLGLLGAANFTTCDWVFFKILNRVIEMFVT